MRSFLLLSPIVTSLLPLSTIIIPSVQAQDGSCSVAAPCWNGACCSQWGWCGSGEPYCGPGCQSGPCYPAGPPPPPPPPTPPPVPTPPPTMRPTLYPQPTVTPVTAAPFDVGNCEAVKMEVNFGYYEDWAVYRNSNCNPLQPDAIEVARFGYTHLAYSFAQVSTDGVLEPYNYYPGSTAHIGPYAAFNSLRDHNVGLKTLIAVGGWTMDQYRFSDAAMTNDSRNKFADSVVDFLNTYKFDGIDMDWEYPVSRQGRPQDKDNYPLLLLAIRAAFLNAGRPDWLITVATSINLQRLDDGYDMPAMEPHIDWFNMMSYDIYGSFSAEAGSNTDMSYIRTTMAVIFNLGVPREKLVLGLAAYGRSSRLSNPTCTTPGCPINGAGLTGCHGESGNLPWFQIKRDYVDTGNYKTLELNVNTGSMEMISTDGYLFTSFDNEVTFNIKYQYAFENCMRGIMWWAVDLITEPIVLLDPSPTLSPTSSDVPSASTGPSIAPSTSLIPTKAPPPTDSPTRMPTRSPIVPPPVPPCGSSCPAGQTGNFATFECTGFRMCVSGGEVASFACAPGTLFDDSLGVCNWASAVSCPCVTTTPPPTPPPVPPGTPTPPPTPPSPTNAGCTPCPASGYTLKSSLDCTGFHYCNVGQLGSYVQCPSGTLFSDAIKGCDWDYNVNCACTSGTAPLPTPPPTPPPAPPSPTGPTPVGTGLWYPDWERTSTCAGDGRQPGWMGAAYFFNTRTECCSAWFWWQATCDA